MKKSIVLNINDQAYELEFGSQPWEISIADTLAHTLRENLDLTGTKVPCDRGECGGCTVLMDGEPVLACSILTVECEGKKIETIESVANPVSGELDPIQQAIVDHDAIQCGMCTPGMVMSLKALHKENPNASRDEIKHAISGNLCRCSGYIKYIEAAESVFKGGDK